MQSSTNPTLLRLLALLLAGGGLFAWARVVWLVPSDLGEVSAESEVGGEMVTLLLLGTTLMILGMIAQHFAQDAKERG